MKLGNLHWRNPSECYVSLVFGVVVPCVCFSVSPCLSSSFIHGWFICVIRWQFVCPDLTVQKCVNTMKICKSLFHVFCVYNVLLNVYISRHVYDKRFDGLKMFLFSFEFNIQQLVYSVALVPKCHSYYVQRKSRNCGPTKWLQGVCGHRINRRYICTHT